MNAKEAARRQKAIKQTLAGLKEMVETSLWLEMDPDQEAQMEKLLLAAGVLARGDLHRDQT